MQIIVFLVPIAIELMTQCPMNMLALKSLSAPHSIAHRLVVKSGVVVNIIICVFENMDV